MSNLDRIILGVKSKNDDDGGHMKNNQHFHDELHAHGLKVTPLRQGILSIFEDHTHPLSAQEIASRLKDIDFDQASLFRCLKKLTETGLLNVVDLGEGFSRYEGHCHSHSHHHHVICRNCKSISILPFCIPKEIETFLKKNGFTEVEHRMDFSGICRKCSA